MVEYIPVKCERNRAPDRRIYGQNAIIVNFCFYYAEERIESMLKEFKEFIMRGNVMDLAVGVIIGGAFTAIVNSLVGDVIGPIIGMICGGIDFTSIAITVGSAQLLIGNFIQAIINFLLVALCVFMLVKAVNKAMNMAKKPEEAPAEEEAPAGPTQEELLTEIRDLLAKK